LVNEFFLILIPSAARRDFVLHHGPDSIHAHDPASRDIYFGLSLQRPGVVVGHLGVMADAVFRETVRSVTVIFSIKYNRPGVVTFNHFSTSMNTQLFTTNMNIMFHL
jgi:hypothetical protein